MLADYVTLEQGTGAVHTAPGHGADDFNTGQRYGLDIYAPIGPSGEFLESVELFAGLKVWDANPKVVEALRERGALWFTETHEHQYPHCWRCHKPLIFLATPQWFIAMDHGGYREKALEAVDAASSGCPRGARSASTTCSPTAPTGASRGSARGACPSPPSTARPAASRCSRPS